LAVASADRVFVLDVAQLLELDHDRMTELDEQLQESLAATSDEPASTSGSPHPIAVQLREMLPLVTTLPVGDVWRIEFTPDGSWVAVASPIGKTRVFKTNGWEQAYELRPSWDLDISPDGRRLATLDTDGIARVWDLTSGNLEQTIPVVNAGLGALEGSLRFAANGRHLLVTDAGSIMVHTTDVDELIEIARSRLTRDLTSEECERFLREPCPTAEDANPSSFE